MNRLFTIRMSHYNEKARWALDRLGVPYRERPYMPLMHALPVAWAIRRAEGYGAVLPSIEWAHPDARAFAQELRTTRAGEHAMRMFCEERSRNLDERDA